MSLYSLSVKPIEEYTSAVIAGIFRSISAAGMFALVLCLIGCGSGFKWQGEWNGNRNLKPAEGENPGITRTLGQVTLQIDSMGFKLKEAGIPYEGTVRYDDGKAYLKIETRLGTSMDKEPQEVQDQNKEIILTSRSDGKIDFYDPGGFFTEPLTLERTAAGSEGKRE
jgi:hypothetical protein